MRRNKTLEKPTLRLIHRTVFERRENKTREDIRGQKEDWTGRKGDKNTTLR